MILRERFEKTGEWMFRRRSYLALPMLGIFLIALLQYEYLGGSEKATNIWEIICLTISFFGLAIRILTIGFTPKGTSGRNTQEQLADTLNTTGLYSILRNPLYLANFFLGLGLALFAHFWWVILIYLLIFWLYYERIIFAEEAFLIKKFGDEYLEWANRTPAFIPKFSQYQKPALPFSLKTVLRREYSGFFAVVVTFSIFKMISTFVVEGIFKLDTGWLIFLISGFIIWMTLRTLKKRTKLLDVEGR